MSHDCCAVPPPRKATCPASGTRGRAVATKTLEALLRPDARLRVSPDTTWFFCDGPHCDVVYFDSAGTTILRRADLWVRVGVKEHEAPRPLCYCFGHTAESIGEEIESTGTSTVAERITAEVRAGRCHCEVTNPSGRCCLGDVRRAVSKYLRLSGEPR